MLNAASYRVDQNELVVIRFARLLLGSESGGIDSGKRHRVLEEKDEQKHE